MRVLAAIMLAAGLLVMAMNQRNHLMKLARLKALTGERSNDRMAGAAVIAERFLPGTVARNLRVLGKEIRARDSLAVLALLCAIFSIAAVLVGLLPALAGLAAIVSLAILLLSILANRRIAAIGELMPSFLDRVRQLLGVGNSLPVAFSRAVYAAHPLLRNFFAPALRRMSNGASFPDTLEQVASDINLYEVRLFATAVTVNMRFGGALTHTLSNLVSYLRKRASLERELRAATTQIRVSAWVLALLPIGVGALIVTQNQEYASWFLSNPTGRWMLGYCALSQAMGLFLMRTFARSRF